MTSNGSWQKVRFDEICKNISDRIDDPKQAKTDYYVGLEHLDSEDPKISRHGNPQDVGATKLKFKTGHILFGKRRWYLRKLAVAEREGICSAHMMVLESINDKIKKEFLPILMQGDNFFEKALSVSAGSLSPTIKWNDMAPLEFLIPSIPQQEEILSLTHKIDQSISDAQNMLEKTKNYMISRRESLLTRGIGHTKFKKVPWYYGKTIEIPEEWEIKKIKDLVENKTILEIQDGNHGELHPKSIDFTNQGLPFLTADCIIDNKIDYEKCKSLPSKFLKTLRIGFSKKEDVILSHKGSVGLTAVVNGKFETIILSPQTTYYRLSKKILPKFLYYVFQTHNFQKQLEVFGKGGTRDYVGITSQQYLIIPFLQDIAEQKQIISILSNIDEQITQQQSHLTNLKVLRKSILNSKLTKEKYN